METLRLELLGLRNALASQFFPSPTPLDSGSRVAIFKPDRLGDFVLALGAIRTLTRHFGERECTLFVSPGVGGLASREFPQAECVTISPFEPKVWSGYWRTRRERSTKPWRHGYDFAITLRHQRFAWQEAIFASLACRKRCGLLNPQIGFSQAERRYIRPDRGGKISIPEQAADSLCLDIEYHRAVVADALGRPVLPQEVLPVITSAPASTDDGTLLLFPFSSLRIKDIPQKTMIEAIRLILDRKPMGLKMVAPRNEEERYRDLASACSLAGLPTPEVLPDAGLEGLIAQVAACRGVISADTGPAHIAAALDKPMVAVLGGGHFGMFAPWRRSQKQIWLYNRVPCYNCGWQCPLPEPVCITGIPASRIAEGFRSVLSLS